MTLKSLIGNEADRPAQRVGHSPLGSAISPENPRYQGALAGGADTAGDGSTRNDSATERLDPGNIRGIRSAPVQADPYIIGSLAKVRWLRRLKGQLPAFRRGKMYFDFRLNKVRILSGPAVAVAFACGVIGLAMLLGGAA